MNSSGMGILYIHASATASTEPLIDDLTRVMAAYCQSSLLEWRRGLRTCACGAQRDDGVYMMPDGIYTHSLGLHNLAFHREDISKAELELIGQLTYSERFPTAQELAAPRQQKEYRGPVLASIFV